MARKKGVKQEPAVGENPSPTEDEIRKRAYEIYCARNGGPGSETDDWLKAQAELKEKRAIFAEGKSGRGKVPASRASQRPR